MTTNELENAGLNSKTLRSNEPELERQFYRTRQHSGIKFKLGHALRKNNLTKSITPLLSGERKKKVDAYKQLQANRRYLSQLMQGRLYHAQAIFTS